MALRPSLRVIKRRYAKHKKQVDSYIEDAWYDWNHLQNPRMYHPDLYGPGGKNHVQFLSRWHHLRLTLRRTPPGTRDRYAIPDLVW